MSPKREYFIAYAHSDSAWTSALAQSLRSLGIDIGNAFADALAGDFLREIERTFGSRDLVAIVTPDSQSSPWVQREIAMALSLHRKVIPVLHRPTEIEGVLANRLPIDVVGVEPDVAAEIVRRRLALDDPAPLIHAASHAEGDRSKTEVRVFLSHATEDNDFTRRLERDLRASRVEVWVDFNEVKADDFYEHINVGLWKSNWLVLVVTPMALAPNKTVIRREVNTAMGMTDTGEMRGITAVVAKPFDIHTMPPLWRNLHRYDATQNYKAALQGLLRALGAQ
jgi:hypothetical protein